MFDLFIFIAALIVACLTILLKAFFTTGLKRKLGLFLISLVLAGLSFVIIIPNFAPHRSHHCSCKAKLEGEANNIASAIADYFAIPTRTQVPSISDLVNSECYILLENRDSKYKKLVEESEFSAAILDGDVNEIPIVVSSKEGRCPFEKGWCPGSKGGVYVLVLKMGDSGGGVWLDSYEEN